MSGCGCGGACEPRDIKITSKRDHHMNDPEMVEKAVRARLAMELDNRISEYEFLAQGAENTDMILAAHVFRVARSIVLNHGIPHHERVEDRQPEGCGDLGEI